MLTRTLEIRDRATFIPVMAIKILCENTSERYLFSRSGYGLNPNAWHGIILLKLQGPEVQFDPYSWPGAPLVRTMQVAHEYIEKHFHELNDGDVIDVEFILGESLDKKTSEIYETTGDAA